MFSYFETEFRLLIALWDGVDLVFCLDVLYWETTIAYISAANCFIYQVFCLSQVFQLVRRHTSSAGQADLFISHRSCTQHLRLCLVLQPINIVTSGQNCRFLLMRSLTIFISGLCSIDSSSTSTWLLPQLVSLFNALSLPSVHRLFFAQQVMSVSLFLVHIS